MKNTYLRNSITIANGKSKYDQHAKNILSDKQILAWILKYTAEEYNCYTIEEICRFIEGQPQVGNISVLPGETKLEKVLGLNTESQIPNEGKNNFDILFYALHPTDQKYSQIFIDLEPQNERDPGYDVVPRGFFYGARIISSQMDTVITTKDYAVRKVYSIWLMLEEGKNANTITSYSVEAKNLYGEYKGEERYDLLTVVMVRLPKSENAENGNSLLKMLTTLFSNRMPLNDKLRILEEEYGLKMNSDQKEDLGAMCNWSDAVIERAEAMIEEGMKEAEKKKEEAEKIKEEAEKKEKEAEKKEKEAEKKEKEAEKKEKEAEKKIEQTQVENIRNLMETLKVSADQAMDFLKVAIEKRPTYIQML